MNKKSKGLSHESFNQGYYERFFIELKKLGRGLRGAVYLCQHVLDDIQLGQYAVKKVAVGDNHEWLLKMLKEVSVLENLSHPNIIDYKHSWIEMHQLGVGPIVPCLFILMDFANGGNLEEFILSRKEPQRASSKSLVLRSQSPIVTNASICLSEDEILSITRQICLGLAHLHSKGIIHRDLKPSNLLLHYRKGDSFPTILLSDFGECEDLNTSITRDRTGATGTLEFMAPELLSLDNQSHYFQTFSQQSDMWSLGMVIYFICYQSLPFKSKENEKIIDEIINLNGIKPPRDRRIPFVCKTLISKLLIANAEKRLTIFQVLNMLENQSSSEVKDYFPQISQIAQTALFSFPLITGYFSCYPNSLKIGVTLFIFITSILMAKSRIGLVLLSFVVVLANNFTDLCNKTS